MNLQALTDTSNFPIRHSGKVHTGKVRSVYWLTPRDSVRLADLRGYDVHPDVQLGVMIISDRFTAFDVQWRAENGLDGVPGKGAALNAISAHWFNRFDEEGLAGNHILESLHPLMWVVQRADPVMIEAIARQYITGSMWRDYSEKGIREFGGVTMPEGLQKDQKLEQLLITPSTKGTLQGIPGVPEKEDVNITRQQIIANYKAFGFHNIGDVSLYEALLADGFNLISHDMQQTPDIFVDTKFEFGYILGQDGERRLSYIDEIGTPDSSRCWDREKYLQGTTVEKSKEATRQYLLRTLDRAILLDSSRMAERRVLAAETKLPIEVFADISATYREMAETITGKPLRIPDRPVEEIHDLLLDYDLAS